MSATAKSDYDVFLSHSHADASTVEKLALRLEDEACFSVWLDKWILIPGQPWQQAMARGLDDAKCCAVCIGKTTPKGWFKEEIQRALNRQTKDGAFRVIPVILPGGESSFVDDFLELRTWVVFQSGVDDQNAFHTLASGIKGVAPGRPPESKSDLTAKLPAIREHLARIRALRIEQLIDEDVALEYQRRLLDRILEP
jgi:TIR domain